MERMERSLRTGNGIWNKIMKILLVAATEQEIEGFREKHSKNNLSYLHDIDILTTGVGMVNTTFTLAQILFESKYDLVINAGIAGSFKKEILLGSIVNITTDIFSEIGAEDGNGFADFVESGLLKKDDIYFQNQNKNFFHPLLESLPNVTGITVNTVHGNENSISSVIKRFNPDVESMEGAAVLYVCKKLKINCLELRSISNYVETRNPETWNIPLAINNLNDYLIQLLSDKINEN